MQRKERYQHILNYFKQHQPNPETELHYGNPWELLIAVVLSAQCTDKRVNLTTPVLFAKFPDAAHMAHADKEEIRQLIKSVTFANSKTEYLLKTAKIVHEQYHDNVPETMEQLVALPGVGRKTANVMLSVIHNKAAMAVDTHVFRVSKRLGLVNQSAKTPLEVERVLIANIPEGMVARAHHWLILHGRYICVARKPKCLECPLTQWCRYYASNYKAIMEGKAADLSADGGVKKDL